MFMLVGDVMFMDTVRFFTRHLRGSSNHIAINIFPFLSLGLENFDVDLTGPSYRMAVMQRD